MMKRLLVGLLGLAMITPQLPAAEQRVGNIMFQYELDSTSTIYCKMVGRNGQSGFNAVPMLGLAAINISSANGNVAATTAGTNPFTGAGVNDVIIVRYPNGVVDARVIITFTDADTIVVNSAFTTTTTGTSFVWYDTQCGTAATDGWVDFAGLENKSITFQLDQVNVTGGVSVRVECKDGALGSLANQVFPACTTGACDTYQNYTTAGIASRTKIHLAEPETTCRFGMKIGTNDDGGDLTTNAEQITVTILGEMAR